MNLFTALVLWAVSTTVHAQYFTNPTDTARRLNFETIIIPLHEPCPTLSMNGPEKICKDGWLYYRAYEITYEFKGKRHVELLRFIPEEEFPVHPDGTVRARNHTVRPDQRF